MVIDILSVITWRDLNYGSSVFQGTSKVVMKIPLKQGLKHYGRHISTQFKDPRRPA